MKRTEIEDEILELENELGYIYLDIARLDFELDAARSEEAALMCRIDELKEGRK